MAGHACSIEIQQQQPDHPAHHLGSNGHCSLDLRASTVGRPGVTRNVGVAKGDGEGSYSRNSKSQAVAVQNLISYIEDAIDSIRLPASAGAGPVIIADLGCATGSNTLKNVDVIVNKLQRRYELSSLQKPEVAVFFNDLPSNDFNSLFLLVAEDTLAGFNSNPDACGKYFAAGVPGSFYCRLFPRSFVHVFFSSYCLHWLSKVPDAVLDKTSPAYNMNSCWIKDAPSEVIAAYRDQSAKDLKDFLRCRAEELHSGGLVFLLFVGGKNSEEVVAAGLFGNYCQIMDSTFQSLVLEGIVTEEQKRSFNVPTFFRSLGEISEVLETFNSEFTVRKMELLPFPRLADSKGRLENGEDPKEVAKEGLLKLRVTKEPLIEAHIGPALSKIYWDRCLEILLTSDLVEKFHARSSRPQPFHQVLLVLERK